MSKRILLLILVYTLPLFGVEVGLSSGGAAAPKKRLLFINFYNTTQNADTVYLETSVIDSIDTLIRDKYHYDRIGGSEWQKFARNNKFNPEDYYRPEKIIEIGYAFRADAIIFGKISPHPDGVLVTGKILSVVEKQVVAEKELVIPLTANMFQGVDEISQILAGKIKDLFVPSDWGAIRRSALLPGWGQFYKQRRKMGYFWASAVGVGFLTASYFTYAYVSKNAAYKSAGIADDPTALYEQAQSNYKTMKIAWFITGSLYLLNLIDAYFFDGDYAAMRATVLTNFLNENFQLGFDGAGVDNSAVKKNTELYLAISWRASL